MMLGRFLRYNARHHLYWSLGGGRDRAPMGWPRLNPISSSYGAGLRVISLHEPLWLFRLRQRWFAFAGRQRCGRRDDMFAMNRGDGELPDTWDLGPDGMRTCSYCGSIHFEDLLTICRRTVEGVEGYGVEGTTKGYKVYVKQPGVRNASEGAIKYYKQHSPVEVSAEDSELFSQAVRVSAQRFEEQMAAWRAEREQARAD